MNYAEGDVTGERYADRYFTVRDGLRLHYRDYAGSDEKPPLLCLPGLTRNSRDFAELAERCSPRFRVIALDFRGRGLSDDDPLPARYMPPTYANDVLELLDQLQISEAVFVGTSLGGLVTMTVALLQPQRIRAAILNDVGPELSNVGIDHIKSYVGKDERFRDWDDVADALAKRNGHIFPGHTHEDWLRMAKRNCREEDGEVRFDYDPAIALPFNSGGETPQFDMWPLFHALAQKPLLLVRGANSQLLAADAAEKMQEAAPGMQLVTVSGVGHAPELNEPEAVSAIDSFLQEI